MAYLVLACWWIAYFALHSILIASGTTRWMQARLKANYRFYRLGYNLFSLAGLGLLWGYAQSLPSAVWFEWNGFIPNAIRVLVALVSAGLLLAAIRAYDIAYFLGIRQISSRPPHRTLSAEGDLKRTGILGLVRHPMYTALFPLIWLRTLTTTALVENILISAYLVIGTRLEEQKLIQAYGSQYITYQQQVSMFFPWKWILGKR